MSPEPEPKSDATDKPHPEKQDADRSPQARPDITRSAETKNTEGRPEKQSEKLDQKEIEERRSVAPAGVFGTDRAVTQVPFAHGSAELSKDAKTFLDQRAASWKPGETMHVDVGASRSGSETVNQNLSDKRAAAIVDYVASKGVDRNSIETRSAGEAEAANKGKPDGKDDRNDRVGLVYTDKQPGPTDKPPVPPPPPDRETILKEAADKTSGKFQGKEEVKPGDKVKELAKDAVKDIASDALKKGKLPTPTDLAKEGGKAAAKFVGEWAKDHQQTMDTIRKGTPEIAGAASNELRRLAEGARANSEGRNVTFPEQHGNQNVDAGKAAARQMYGELTDDQRKALNTYLSDKNTGDQFQRDLAKDIRSGLLQMVGTVGGRERSQQR